VALTVAFVALIGGMMVVVGSDGEVPSSQADITALNFGPRPKVEQFSDSLRALGHSEPRVFELNGNRIFFSTAHPEESPKRVLRQYQDEFVRQGLNGQAFYELRADEMMQRNRTSLTGGVVPMEIAPSRVVMSGVDTRGNPMTLTELLDNHDRSKSAGELFDAYRWVEVYRHDDEPHSTVIATWSDQRFDYDKMFPQRQGRPSKDVDPRVPVCRGCLKVNQFGERARAGTHESYVFVTGEHPDELRAFYRSNLEARGWRLGERASVFEQVMEQVDFEADETVRLEFVREDLMLEVTFFPMEEEGQTGVRTVLMDQKFMDEIENRANPRR
jgi:hypothetical protein